MFACLCALQMVCPFLTIVNKLKYFSYFSFLYFDMQQINNHSFLSLLLHFSNLCNFQMGTVKFIFSYK